MVGAGTAGIRSTCTLSREFNRGYRARNRRVRAPIRLNAQALSPAAAREDTWQARVPLQPHPLHFASSSELKPKLYTVVVAGTSCCEL